MLYPGKLNSLSLIFTTILALILMSSMIETWKSKAIQLKGTDEGFLPIFYWQLEYLRGLCIPKYFGLPPPVFTMLVEHRQVTQKGEMKSKLFFLEGSSESFHFLIERVLILSSGKATENHTFAHSSQCVKSDHYKLQQLNQAAFETQRPLTQMELMEFRSLASRRKRKEEKEREEERGKGRGREEKEKEKEEEKEKKEEKKKMEEKEKVG
ncbi:hypothetical protein DUI87_12871 [Hirundo rustica rustica]|uniref:Uncharacterized protein n=1 Tax=Hirundo rustica rustica TaxID=333673 RepID=A0A3M0KA62_HIRRU|nr:hypothetical protein DUI87_12871 [Hirundo rustica rustica]